MSKPTVVIIAGGSNSRFFPFNVSTHKGAITLLGEKLIVRTLRSLEAHGFEKVVIVVAEKDFGGKGLSGALTVSHFRLEIQFVLQPKALGMGDAVLQARSLVNDRFAVIFPVMINAGQILSEMDRLGENVVCSAKTKYPWLYGILTIKNGKATSLVEKPKKGTEKSDNRIEGAYILTKEYLEILSNLPVSEYNFEEALNTLMEKNPIPVYQMAGDIPSLKYPWHLYNFQRVLFTQLKSFRAQSAQIANTALIDESAGKVHIEEGSVIGDFVKIVGPAYIGKNSLVGDYSFVRQSSIEENCQVGANTEVVRSIIMAESTIHFGYLADSIIGQNVKIGAGFITANKRLDRANVPVTIKGERVSSTRNAFGVLVGDNTAIGIRVSTMPGVFIGSGCTIFPGLVISKNVDHHQVVKA